MGSLGTFRAADHIYQLDGRTVPSVTQVLTLAGLDELARVPKRFLVRPAAIGTAVHLATHFLDDDDLELEALDPAIVGYVLGWQRFKLEHEFVPLIIERRGVSISPDGPAFGFCLDRIGMLDGQEVLVDIKTGSKKYPSWAIQTAGYADAVNFEGARLSVHVAYDGTYQIVDHPDPGDFPIWRQALQLAHWKLNHGARIPK